MRKIPELLLRCCSIILNPYSIKLLNNCVKITFFCPKCRNWVRLEIRNGMKNLTDDIDKCIGLQVVETNKKANKIINNKSSYKYIKGSDTNGKKRNKKVTK